VTIGDADLAAADPSPRARATPESRPPRPSLVIPGFGEIVDNFDYLEIDLDHLDIDLDYLEIDGHGAWLPSDRSAKPVEAALEETMRSARQEATESTARSVHPDRFRQALAHLPAPVTLVTCAALDDAPIGATVSAFSSLSLDPPLVVVSLDRRSGTLDSIRSRRAFAVHVLGDGHRSLATRFAERRGDKFHELEFERNNRGVPLLAQYSFRFECVLHDEFPGGDHVLVVGAVEELSEHEVAQDPVVWYGRTFQRLSGD
jgi:flavin reductase (DIM6/NTAB) family NADH-FMN oxidoreductase RutF